MASGMAKATFEMENSVKSVASVDEIFRYNDEEQKKILQAKPWQKEYAFLGVCRMQTEMQRMLMCVGKPCSALLVIARTTSRT